MLKDPHSVSWPTAIALAVVAVGVAAVALAVIPNLIVNRLGASREVRVAIATAYEVVAFAGVAWGAARVQRRSAS